MAGKFDPQNAQNLMEAQTYWNLLEKVAPRELKLTKLDDDIFNHAIEFFPEFSENDYAKLVKLDEDWMKSADGKKRWRTFINSYENKVKDYNFGCLIRTDARQEYGETNTIFVTRMQASFVPIYSSPHSTQNGCI
ncbi:hypothetical protein DXG03_006033 [Asterophora parasitica]|uniref:Polysaccharide biosynthesis domain-containing protein n=1 Tax=Asterophora parasitica TaxID=117018 RepID=A0A9P7K7B0_9AGAR|nr:hypothetical protein DXG03_006033 [Asterophora parasitica]